MHALVQPDHYLPHSIRKRSAPSQGACLRKVQLQSLSEDLQVGPLLSACTEQTALRHERQQRQGELPDAPRPARSATKLRRLGQKLCCFNRLVKVCKSAQLQRSPFVRCRTATPFFLDPKSIFKTFRSSSVINKSTYKC